MTDFLIAGGGLIGLLTARELARAGAAVTVIERGEPGRESSWAGGGILSPLYPWRYPDAVNALARWSQPRFARLADELRKESGLDPEYLASGLLILDANERARAREWAQRYGARLETAGVAAVATLAPGVNVPPDGALWMPEVAQVRNPRLLAALLHANERAGVRIEIQTGVTGFVMDAGRVAGVETVRGRRAAGAVVVAGGAWTGALLGPLGPGPSIVPVRGQMLLFRAAPGALERIVLSHGRYLVPRRDGHILAGSTLEYTGFDVSTTPQAYEELHAAAVAMFPALARCPVERHWAGLRPGTVEGIPVIGAHPVIEGLFVNAGHFRNGVVTAPASARLLADIALGRPPVLDTAPYAWRVEAG